MVENVFPVGIWDEEHQTMVYQLQSQLPKIAYISGVGVVDQDQEGAAFFLEEDPGERDYWM
jgi:hypothetical protein